MSKITLGEAISHCPALRNITHFEILSLKGSELKELVEFPNLTHLCFDVHCHVEGCAKSCLGLSESEIENY